MGMQTLYTSARTAYASAKHVGEFMAPASIALVGEIECAWINRRRCSTHSPLRLKACDGGHQSTLNQPKPVRLWRLILVIRG